ncbi:MAG: InlB B-repeat-containing protein [Candidatus Nanopelagicaceae bacterium]
MAAPPAQASTFTVTYDPNATQHQSGVTSGSVPTTTSHTSGDVVTVASNTGNLARQGFTFVGWNTQANGAGTTYTPGSGTFAITSNTILYAKWEIPASARLIGAGGNILTISNPNNNVSSTICETYGIRGITSDGNYLYFRVGATTREAYICQTDLEGRLVEERTISGLSTNLEQRDLTYSSGCIFLRPLATAESSLQCIDTSSWTLHTINLPQPLFAGSTWLFGNLIDFPDGRIGAVSAPSPGGFFSASVSNECPPGFYCKTLRLYEPTGTGQNLTLNFSEDILLADTQSSWPSDDHGIATDGTYLYQTHHANGYKVWALRSGSPSYLVFNGDGVGSCGASTGISGTKCTITYPITGNSGGEALGNSTFMGRVHSTGQYLMGDYSYPKIYVSDSATPPPGPGSIQPDSPVITTQPSDAETTLNFSASFFVSAYSSDTGTISYQWQESTTSTSLFQDIPSANGDSITVTGTSIRNLAQYRVVIGNTRSGVTTYETSTAAILTVNSAISLAGGSAITTSYGQVASSTPISTSGGTGSIVFSYSPLISGVTINSSTGAVTVSSAVTPGSYTRTITATDQVGATATQSITITVNVATGIISLGISGALQKGSIVTLTASTSSTGTVTFSAKNRPIESCSNKVVNPGTLTATCLWRVKIHGPQDLVARYTSTDSNWSNAQTRRNVVVTRRTSR